MTPGTPPAHLFEIIKTKIKLPRLPRAATGAISQKGIFIIIPIATKSAAPAELPNIHGEANSFLSVPWRSNPDIEREEPASKP